MAKYKKNFLKQVIARVDFPVPLEGIESSVNKEFIREINRLFPIQEPIESLGKSLKLSDTETTLKDEKKIDWFFYGKNKEKKLCLAPNCMFIELYKYKSFGLARFQ